MTTPPRQWLFHHGGSLPASGVTFNSEIFQHLLQTDLWQALVVRLLNLHCNLRVIFIDIDIVSDSLVFLQVLQEIIIIPIDTFGVQFLSSFKTLQLPLPAADSLIFIKHFLYKHHVGYNLILQFVIVRIIEDSIFEVKPEYNVSRTQQMP